MLRIMIVEDDKALSAGIAMALRQEDLSFEKAYTLEEGRKKQRENPMDLLLLDINLPDGSGLDFLKEIKEEGETSVILLTANDLEADIVSGLSLGADDYVTKPFSLPVLRARVEVQLRKKREGSQVFLGPYRFDFGKQEFFRKEEGAAGAEGSEEGWKKIELSRTEQRLLRILTENKGRTVAREQMISYVWPMDWEFVEENALSVAVNRLRGKLSDKACIRTVYGIGYCWEAGERKL